MIIASSNPVVVPAVPEEVYDALWLHEIHIAVPPEGPGYAHVMHTPWKSGTTKTQGTPQQFTITDLMAKLQTDTDFQTAWGGVTAVIAKYMAEANVAAEPA